MQPDETRPALSERTADPADFLHPIDFLRGEHERQRWFCKQLVTLSDDIWQPGHEKLAALLLDFAIVDIANNMEDESQLLLPALLRCSGLEDGSEKVVTEMLFRHQYIATLVAPTIDGLERLALGEVPLVPMRFILSVVELVEILDLKLDWEDTVLLPLAASRLTKTDRSNLGSAMARRYGVFALN